MLALARWASQPAVGLLWWVAAGWKQGEDLQLGSGSLVLRQAAGVKGFQQLEWVAAVAVARLLVAVVKVEVMRLAEGVVRDRMGSARGLVRGCLTVWD